MARAKYKKPTAVTLQFDNHDALHHFWVWMCESGEQEYLQWMEAREQECDEPDITALEFEYRRADLGLIGTRCGRKDSVDE